MNDKSSKHRSLQQEVQDLRNHVFNGVDLIEHLLRDPADTAKAWAREWCAAEIARATPQPAAPTANEISELSPDNKAQPATSNLRVEFNLVEPLSVDSMAAVVVRGDHALVQMSDEHDEQFLVWSVKEARALRDWLTKALPVETSALPLCDGEVRIIYEHGEPKGVRDTTGYLCFFNRVNKYDGQEDRYRKELALRARHAEVIANALRSAVEPAEEHEDKADLLSMAALVARMGRDQAYSVPADLLKRASAVLVALAETRVTRRHRGCGSDCTLPAGHLGDHVPPENGSPVISEDKP